MSTAISDLVLALACVVSAVWALRHAEIPRRYAAVGMAAMAAAAGIGCVRFFGVESLAPAHRFVSHLAGGVAPGCFALVALAVARGSSRRFVEIGVVALAVAWVVFDPILDLAIYRTAIGSLAVLVMIGVGGRERSRAGVELIAGALILALAGLVIGTEGNVGLLLAIDVFHVSLAVAHLLIGHGLVSLRAFDG